VEHDPQAVADQLGDAGGRPQVRSEPERGRLPEPPRPDQSLLFGGQEPGPSGDRLGGRGVVPAGPVRGHPLGHRHRVDAQEVGHVRLRPPAQDVPDGQLAAGLFRRRGQLRLVLNHDAEHDTNTEPPRIACLTCESVVQTTFVDGFENHWHNQTRELFVEGVTDAVRAGGAFAEADLPIIWAIALAFSYWHSEGDNSDLRAARDALLSQYATQGGQRPLIEALARTTRSSSLDSFQPVDPPEAKAHAAEKPAPAPTADSILDVIRRGGYVLPSVAATVLSDHSANGVGASGVTDTILAAIGVEFGSEWTYGDRDVPSSMDAITRIVSDDQLWLIVTAIWKRCDKSGRYQLSGIAPNLLALALALARAKMRGDKTLPRASMRSWKCMRGGPGSERVGGPARGLPCRRSPRTRRGGLFASGYLESCSTLGVRKCWLRRWRGFTH
jgi:hypothetical protein